MFDLRYHVASLAAVFIALALDEIPPELTAVMDNVVVLVEDEPPDGERNLLGLYEGTP